MPSGSYLSTDMPFTGASANRIVLLDARGEHAVAEVLLEDLDRLLGVDRPGVHQRRQDALDLDVGVELLADHRERVLELDQPAHRQILALDGDDNLVGGRQGVDRQQPEARRRVDADEVVVLAGSARSAFSSERSRPILVRHRDLGAGEVDRGAGDVDLALADRPRGSRCRARARRTSTSRPSRGRCPGDIVRLPCGSMSTHSTRWPASAKAHGEVEGGGRLGDAALLVGERDDLGLAGHGALRSVR